MAIYAYKKPEFQADIISFKTIQISISNFLPPKKKNNVVNSQFVYSKQNAKEKTFFEEKT